MTKKCTNKNDKHPSTILLLFYTRIHIFRQNNAAFIIWNSSQLHRGDYLSKLVRSSARTLPFLLWVRCARSFRDCFWIVRPSCRSTELLRSFAENRQNQTINHHGTRRHRWNASLTPHSQVQWLVWPNPDLTTWHSRLVHFHSFVLSTFVHREPEPGSLRESLIYTCITHTVTRPVDAAGQAAGANWRGKTRECVLRRGDGLAAGSRPIEGASLCVDPTSNYTGELEGYFVRKYCVIFFFLVVARDIVFFSRERSGFRIASNEMRIKVFKSYSGIYMINCFFLIIHAR